VIRLIYWLVFLIYIYFFKKTIYNKSNSVVEFTIFFEIRSKKKGAKCPFIDANYSAAI